MIDYHDYSENPHLRQLITAIITAKKQQLIAIFITNTIRNCAGVEYNQCSARIQDGFHGGYVDGAAYDKYS